MNIKATEVLNSLKRISYNQINNQNDTEEQVLLLPSNVKLEIDENQQIRTIGLGELDKKKKDLLNHIKIIDPLNLIYQNTNILMPRTYAESLVPIPEHISVQCLIFATIDYNTAKFFNELNTKNPYGKTYFDKLIITRKDNLKINEGDIVYVMNRRIGGWDGSIDRPVIELLGAGGHLATYWDSELHCFRSMSFIDNLQREFEEELKIAIAQERFSVFGGFHNKESNELVVLCGAFINGAELVSIFKNSQKNIEEDLAGIYIGYFDEIISMYLEDASSFAGGDKAKDSNFPSQRVLMEKVDAYLKHKNITT